MEQEKIIRKISALMNMTVENGATKDEAISAALKAQELMAKYHITVLENPKEKEIVDEEDIQGSRKWIQILANIVCRNMSCKLITYSENHTTFLKFIGRKSDRKAALKTFEMLVSVCKTGIRKEKFRAKNKSGNAKGIESAYAAGFIKAVDEEMGKQCRALMLVVPEEVDEHIRKNYPNLRSEKISFKFRYSDKNLIENVTKQGYSDGKNFVGQRKIGEW